MRQQTLNAGQNEIYQLVMEAVQAEAPLQLFIDAYGGCGKTYLLNTILRAVRSLTDNGCIALATATTGIAANMLELGRTFHSRLKAPLKADESSVLNITVQSQLANMIRVAKLIMVDEATMLNRYLLEALDRSLRDIMDMQDMAFGGKVIVLAGDFRQCLPVVKGGSRSDCIKQCVNQSRLWHTFQVRRLTENMRVRALGDPHLQEFSDRLIGIGNGCQSEITVPDHMFRVLINSESDALRLLSSKVFPHLDDNIRVPGWLEGRAILTPTNQKVNVINKALLALLN